MNYPKHIYKQYEIVEKDIHGEKHYGLVRVYNFFGIKIRRQLKVCCSYPGGYFGGTDQRKWWNSRFTIEDSIKQDHEHSEDLFRKSVTK